MYMCICMCSACILNNISAYWITCIWTNSWNSYRSPKSSFRCSCQHNLNPWYISFTYSMRSECCWLLLQYRATHLVSVDSCASCLQPIPSLMGSHELLCTGVRASIISTLYINLQCRVQPSFFAVSLNLC